MTKRVAFWVFILGTVVSGVVFLWATLDTHRQISVLAHADRLSDQVVAGKRAFERKNCNDCHTVLGFGGYYGPDLTRVIRRVGEDGFRYRVQHPEEAFARSWRKMPRLRVTDQEAADMVAFLTWMDEVDNGDWPPQDSKSRLSRAAQVTMATATVTPGAALYQTSGCPGCHALGGQGGSFGPALDGVGQRRDEAEIERLLRDPRSVNPKALMPPQQLSDAEFRQIAAFLADLR